MSPSNETTNAQHEKGRLDPDKIEAEILANDHFSSRSMTFCGCPTKRANDCVTLAQKSLAWHKTTLVQFDLPRGAINIELCRRFHRLPAMQRLKRACFGSDSKMRSSPR